MMQTIRWIALLSLFITPAFAHAQFRLAPAFDASVGQSPVTGGSYAGAPSRRWVGAGAAMEVAGAVPDLTMSLGLSFEQIMDGDAVRECAPGGRGCGCLSTGPNTCVYESPGFGGSFVLLGARFEPDAEAALSVFLGCEYFGADAGGDDGSRAWLGRVELVFRPRGLIDVGIRGEHLSLVDYGGVSLQSNPISVVVRVRR